ncbi:SDR family oxidoreductase [Sorangium sp. So ce590]|uniref:SDR family NAD(P)-dependent oxidoreductase n=1 Tax=Sorangium sp. So ce590 TaxID=3133317 RepID=UPI003F634AEE
MNNESTGSDALIQAGANPRWGAYGASKAALDHLSRTWAAEIEGTGVAFYAVDPGEMNTRMHAKAIPDADPGTLADPADVARRIVALIARAGEAPSGARFEAARLPEAP